MNRRILLLGTGLFAAMGVSAKSLAMDASLLMKAADIDPAFQKAFNGGDLDTLLKLYDDSRRRTREACSGTREHQTGTHGLSGTAINCSRSCATLRMLARQ
jgi:hypothetical protein